MEKNTLLIVAFVLLLIPYPLISLGTVGGIAWLWWLGLGSLVVGGLIPPAARYLFSDDDDENGSEGEFTKSVDGS